MPLPLLQSQIAGQPGQSLPPLSPRQAQVLRAIDQGKSYKQTADLLKISINTVRANVRLILTKAHAGNMHGAIHEYRRAGVA
jgi:DNA-binding CsgD family transcriptional regulator